MKLIGMAKIANFLGQHRVQVDRLIREEGFPAKRVDGQWEAEVAEIDAWRENRAKS
jgi:predicted DNA-binding transcriptional regulator AlpA